MGKRYESSLLSHSSFSHCESRNNDHCEEDRLITWHSSFVTSFFGMNTTDVRDMEWNQKIFWSSAIPLTLAVLSIALLYGYKWDLIISRVRSACRSRQEPGLHAICQEDLESWVGPGLSCRYYDFPDFPVEMKPRLLLGKITIWWKHLSQKMDQKKPGQRGAASDLA